MTTQEIIIAENIICKHIAGIVKVEYNEDSNTFYIQTKNVFCDINRLNDLKFGLFASNIEIGIVALTGNLAYTIYL